MDRIEEIYDEMGEVDNEETIERVEQLTEKIKKMRQSGLESGGEFSVENIVFKVLRRNGMLDRLYDIKTVAYDKSVTLESNQLTKLTESMLGDELGWIRDTNPTPIDKEGGSFGDHGAEFDIVVDYFNKQRVQQEGEWRYSMDSLSGSIDWWSGDHEIIFYATPFWNGEDFLPIEYQGDMGDYDTVVNIDLPKFYYKEELINWLENEYPKIVHKVIIDFMDDVGPLYESVDKRLINKIKKFKPKEEIEKVITSFKKFREAMKQEGRETKEAWSIISKSMKEKRKLTDDELKKVKTQMGDLFKATGLTIATFLPGGTLYLLLTKVPSFKKYLLPSAFHNDSDEFKE